ncbi:cytochrome P460 family protein [Marinobacterium rhizophilum]|uniref:cytochrome P460 family protein n=1 Tax=Marinobacterium rhizophilum TaxID=420402 RepID=UPI001969DE3E|nr:cytochrome P460 family protein [Marinobacterium rhizophilum]
MSFYQIAGGKSMKLNTILVALFLVSTVLISNASEKLPGPSHGISYPSGWQDWASISVSHRTDNNTLRMILGNAIAVKAARSGQTNPWPDGAILGKVVWKEKQLENWKAAISPEQLVHVEFMFKDSEKYTSTYGWGWARWVGDKQEPFNNGPEVCTACHTPVKDRDWVFTDPAPFPAID